MSIIFTKAIKYKFIFLQFLFCDLYEKNSEVMTIIRQHNELEIINYIVQFIVKVIMEKSHDLKECL